MAFRKVRINWKFKGAVFNVLDKFYIGGSAYYFIQRYITRTIPRKLYPTQESGSIQLRHFHRIVQGGLNPTDMTLLEIGAGWDLFSNLIYYCMGIDRQIAIDIRRWARADAINFVIKHLQNDPPAGHVRLPTRLIAQHRLQDDLKLHYGIEYVAPVDAKSTPFEDGCIDAVVSTSVLEHVPLEDLQDIVKEVYRLLVPGGLASHTIDYSDHYAHADGSINVYNYLRFSEDSWTKFNPAIHYQNRARSRDYTNQFNEVGFKIIEQREWIGVSDELADIQIDKSFSDYSISELLSLGADYFLQKPN